MAQVPEAGLSELQTASRLLSLHLDAAVLKGCTMKIGYKRAVCFRTERTSQTAHTYGTGQFFFSEQKIQEFTCACYAKIVSDCGGRAAIEMTSPDMMKIPPERSTLYHQLNHSFPKFKSQKVLSLWCRSLALFYKWDCVEFTRSVQFASHATSSPSVFSVAPELPSELRPSCLDHWHFCTIFCNNWA